LFWICLVNFVSLISVCISKYILRNMKTFLLRNIIENFPAIEIESIEYFDFDCLKLLSIIQIYKFWKCWLLKFGTMPKTARCGNVNAPKLLWLYSFRWCDGNIHECVCVKTSECSVHSNPVNGSVSVVWEIARPS